MESTADNSTNNVITVYAATGPDFYDYERETVYCWRHHNSNRNWRIFSTENYRKFWDTQKDAQK